MSGVGNALGLIVLGAYMMVKSWNVDVESINWIPLVSLSWTIFISSIGITSLTTTCISEIMPEKIKDAGLSFCMTLLFTFSFLNIKYLPVFIEVLGFHVTMYAFAGLCLVLTMYIILFMPETNGKSHQEIMKSLQWLFRDNLSNEYYGNDKVVMHRLFQVKITNFIYFLRHLNIIFFISKEFCLLKKLFISHRIQINYNIMKIEKTLISGMIHEVSG